MLEVRGFIGQSEHALLYWSDWRGRVRVGLPVQYEVSLYRSGRGNPKYHRFTRTAGRGILLDGFCSRFGSRVLLLSFHQRLMQSWGIKVSRASSDIKIIHSRLSALDKHMAEASTAFLGRCMSEFGHRVALTDSPVSCLIRPPHWSAKFPGPGSSGGRLGDHRVDSQTLR